VNVYVLTTPLVVFEGLTLKLGMSLEIVIAVVIWYPVSINVTPSIVWISN
jgi:hypothetical protein